MNGPREDIIGQTLHELARADAKHDFKGAAENTKDLAGFFAGLLFGRIRETALDEDNSLKMVLGNRTFESIGNDESFITSSGFTYNLQIMPNIRESRNFGADLADKIGGLEAAIVVDFAQHQFMEKMREGEKPEFTVHYLYTQEVDNDPAGKPNVFNKSLFGIDGNGIQVYSYLLNSSQETHYYTAYESDKADKSNKFYSKYLLSISTNIDSLDSDKIFKPISTLAFTYAKPDGKTYTKVIYNSGEENSINKIKGFINELGDSDMRNFHTAVKYQQKRSGDWLQVLACNEVRSRSFRRVLPSAANFTLDNNCPVFFVSHDRIAIAYALFMGINAIFIKQNGEVLILKNMQDPAFESGVPFEQRLFENMQAKYSKKVLETLITTASVYSEAIESTTINKAFDDDIREALDNLRNIRFNVSNIGDFQTSVNREMKKLFKSCVKKAFYIKTCRPIADDEFSIVKKAFREHILEGSYDSSIDVKKLQLCIRSLEAIQTKYGSIAKREDFTTAILNWINKNAILLDVYRAANTFDLYNSNDQESMFQRVKTLAYGKPSNDQTKTVDNHLFLPYIMDLPERDIICDVLEGLMPQMQQYLGAQAQRTVRTRRINADTVDPFYYIIVHLITETISILKQDTIEEKSIYTPEDVLIATEYDNTHELSSESIPINSTQVDKETVVQSSKRFKTGTTAVEISDAIEEYVEPITESLPRSEYRANQGQGPYIVQAPYHMMGGSNFITKNISIEKAHRGVLQTVDNNNIIWPMLYRTMMAEPMNTSSSTSSANSNEYYQRIMRYFNATIAGGGTTNKAKSYLQYTAKQVNLPVYGFHPYLPLYCMCTSIYNALDPRIESYPFFDDIVRLVHILSHLFNSINKSMSMQKLDIIARGLYTLFFCAHTGDIMYHFIPDTHGFDHKKYRTFSVVNDMYANKFAGARLLNREETKLHMAYICNPVFNKYMKYVKMGEMMDLQVKSMSYIALKAFVKGIMKAIVENYKKPFMTINAEKVLQTKLKTKPKTKPKTKSKSKPRSKSKSKTRSRAKTRSNRRISAKTKTKTKNPFTRTRKLF